MILDLGEEGPKRYTERPAAAPAPSVPAMAIQLQRTVGNRATTALLSGQRRSGTWERPQLLQRAPWDLADPPAAGPAGGCGLCYAEEYEGAIGPRDAGTQAHRIIQQAMWGAYPDMIKRELPVSGKVRGKKETGLIDLAREVPPNTLEIGEIKPSDSDDVAIRGIEWYLELVATDPRYKKYNVRPLELTVPKPLTFPTLSPDCPKQTLSVANVKGLYLYFCEPSFAKLKQRGCKCKKRRRDDEKRPEVPFPIPIRPGPDVGIEKGEGKGNRRG